MEQEKKKRIRNPNDIEKNKQYCKEWYINNKQQHLSKMKEEVITCELCKKVIKKYKYNRHCMGIKHKLLENKNV
jgi:hypothetical protein